MILWGPFGQLCEISHYVFPLCGILKLMLCHVVIWVLNIEQAQVQRSSRSTGEETNTNNMPYPALKCLSSPRTSAAQSLCIQLHTHSSQSINPNPKRCWSAASRTVPASFNHRGGRRPVVINGQSAGRGKRGRLPPRLFCLIASALTSSRVWLCSAGKECPACQTCCTTPRQQITSQHWHLMSRRQ